MATKVKRVSRDRVRDNAKKGPGGGSNWFKLPDHVRQYAPEKKVTLDMNFYPYIVSSDKHPDDVKPGELWFKYPFKVHHGIGPNNMSIVCPTTIGKPCPLCEEKVRLSKNYDENKVAIKVVKPQSYVAYNIEDPDDKDAVAVFAMSWGKFAKPLEKELKENDEVLDFYDVTDQGKTLTVRFTDEEFTGDDGKKSDFLQATRIDFVDREALDEQEILGKVVCLDEMFVVLEYNKIEELWKGDEDASDGDGKGAKGKVDKPEQSSGKPRKPAATAPKEEPEKSKTEFKVGDRVSFKDDGGQDGVGEIKEIDEADEEAVVEDDAGDEHDCDLGDLTAEKPKGKADKADKAKPAADKGDKHMFKIGDRVEDTDKVVGVVFKIDDDDVHYKDDDGHKFIEDAADLKPAADDDAPTAKHDKSGKADKAKSSKPKWTHAIGDDVKWTDDGEEKTGEIIKLLGTDRAKVKDDGGTTHKLALSDLALDE